jgi:alpha-aminoadipate carrier protein LysW
MGTCPECEAVVDGIDAVRGNIISCPDCGVELEVIAVNPIQLEMLKPDEYDFGE